MKKTNITAIALFVCLAACGGGAFYYCGHEAIYKVISGRALLDQDFLARFSYAYELEPNGFIQLRIASINNGGGLTTMPKGDNRVIYAQSKGGNKYLIGYGIKAEKPQVVFLDKKEANKFFDELAFPNPWTRHYLKWQIYHRVYEMVGDPGDAGD